MRRLSFLPILHYAVAALSLCLIAILLFSLQNPVALDDGLRHFAMARLMSEQGITHAHWSKFFSHGYFAHHVVDPWFLSNIAFIPLLPLGPVLALKVFALFSVTLLLCTFLYACRVLRASPIVASVAIGLLLFFEPTFFYRLLLARPYELITPLAVLIIVAAIAKRPLLIGAALMLCVLLSQLFIFPLVIALICVLWRSTLWEWEEAALLLSWIIVGVLAGFLLHPDSLRYIVYIRDTFLSIPLIPDLQLGAEMRSGIPLGSRVLVMVAVLLLFHAELFRQKIPFRQYQKSGLSLVTFLSTFFLLLFLLWARAIDFLWPILLLQLLLLQSVVPEIFWSIVTRFLPKKFDWRAHYGTLILSLLLASVFVFMSRTLMLSDKDRSLEIYSQSLINVAPGSRVLNPDWHFFMPAVAVRPDLRYATGIDPSYTYLDSPRALELLVTLNTPAFQSSPTEAEVREWLQNILAQYPSEYLVLFQSRHKALIAELQQGLQMKNISGTREVAVFDTSHL